MFLSNLALKHHSSYISSLVLTNNLNQLKLEQKILNEITYKCATRIDYTLSEKILFTDIDLENEDFQEMIRIDDKNYDRNLEIDSNHKELIEKIFNVNDI